MWKKPEKPQAIHPSQLVLGLYVWLDMSWDEHPFLYNKFRITTEKQLLTLRCLHLQGKLYYFAEKSTEAPGPVDLSDEVTAAEIAQNNQIIINAKVARQGGEVSTESLPETGDDLVKLLQEEKQARLRKQKEAATRADRAWEESARVTREAMLGMVHSPKNAGAQLLNLSRQTASLISQQKEVLLHLLGDKEGEGPQFHALNVMTLSMLLGKAAGLNEAALADVALGALAHDIGKYKVPQHLLKAKTRSKHEEEFYRLHGMYGIALANISDAFSPGALSAISDHHEFLDGSGWPSGKKAPGPIARIVGLANRYDRLCAPESPERTALLPAEAIAYLFRKEANKFDPRLINLMVKLLGVYPPGTIVRLNDDALGLVVAPGRESLRPVVLVYAPEFNKDEAPTIDLASNTDIKIEEAIRPNTLPADVLAWLSPRQRLSYFFSTEPK
jgi:HD-GYP domain-containing protein (c-di-GMP phosphodiesterase class II)